MNLRKMKLRQLFAIISISLFECKDPPKKTPWGWIGGGVTACVAVIATTAWALTRKKPEADKGGKVKDKDGKGDGQQQQQGDRQQQDPGNNQNTSPFVARIQSPTTAPLTEQQIESKAQRAGKADYKYNVQNPKESYEQAPEELQKDKDFIETCLRDSYRLNPAVKPEILEMITANPKTNGLINDRAFCLMAVSSDPREYWNVKPEFAIDPKFAEEALAGNYACYKEIFRGGAAQTSVLTEDVIIRAFVQAPGNQRLAIYTDENFPDNFETYQFAYQLFDKVENFPGDVYVKQDALSNPILQKVWQDHWVIRKGLQGTGKKYAYEMHMTHGDKVNKGGYLSDGTVSPRDTEFLESKDYQACIEELKKTDPEYGAFVEGRRKKLLEEAKKREEEQEKTKKDKEKGKSEQDGDKSQKDAEGKDQSGKDQDADKGKAGDEAKQDPGKQPGK